MSIALFSLQTFASDHEMKTWTTHNGNLITQILSGRSNVFLVSTNNCNILIDTGHKREIKKLEKNLNQQSITSIDFLVLTHTHFDHSGNAAFIKEKYHPKVIVHQSEADYLEKGSSPLPKGTIFSTKLLIGIVRHFPYFFRVAPSFADITINNSLVLNELSPSTSIIHTPGHSKGSVSVIVDNEIAIVGDTMFGIYDESILPPFADNLPDLSKSWEKLLETNCFVFLPSHGKPIKRERVEKNIRIRKTN